MKRKHFLPIAILLCFLIKRHDGVAQKFYTEVGGGYALPIASQNLTSKVDNGITQTTNVLVKGSLGSGVVFNGTIGYNKNEHLAAELGISYLISHKYHGSYLKEMDYKEKTTISATMLRLSPGIRLTVGDRNIKLYGRIGATFRLAGKIKIENEQFDLSTNSTTQIDWEYKGGYSFGVTTSLGVIRKANDNLFIFGELGMVNQSWAPKKGKIIKYDIDGIDMTERLNPYQKEVDFSDNYTTTNYNPSSTSGHRQQLKQYFPFSAFGINLGIHYYISKRKIEKK